MDYEAVGGGYLEANPTWHQEDSPYKAGFVQKMLDRNPGELKTIADVGCGAGLVAELMAKDNPGSSVTGYDIAPEAMHFWGQRSQANLQFKAEDILAVQDRYDLITCLDVFEHVEDYFGFLRRLRPRARRHIFNIPLDMNVLKMMTGLHYARKEVGHLHYFNAYTGEATLRDCGYAIEDRFISNAARATPPRNMRQRVVAGPRIVASMLLGDAITAKLMGGGSLVVMTRSD